MDTSKNNIYEKFLYNPLSNIYVLKPFHIWKNANTQLNKKYKEPHINLIDDEYGLFVKNTARHTTGLGLAASQYGIFAYPMGYLKEGLDLTKDFFTPPIGKISPEVWEDTKIDLYSSLSAILINLSFVTFPALISKDIAIVNISIVCKIL